MSQASTMRGICAACRHDPDCIYSRDFDRPPLQCEQFELSFPEPEAVPADGVSPSEWGAALGLCANCDHRANCIYPKPEGGVWRCEEYQ